MYPKKVLIIQILEILRKYSNEKNPLTQAQIVKLLMRDYDIECDRKTVKRNIDALLDLNIDLYSDQHQRNLRNGEETVTNSNWHYVHDFTEAELHLIINSILFSRSIPNTQGSVLIDKLKNLSSVHFKTHTKHISRMSHNFPENKQLFYTVEILDEAIEQRKQVRFKYIDFGIDKKPFMRKDSNGQDKLYTISPYRMVAANGRHYLICVTEPDCRVSHFRLDRIVDIKMLDDKSRPPEIVKEFERGFNLPNYLAEQIYMFTGDRVKTEFLIDKNRMIDVIDWFGTDITTRDSKDGKTKVSVTVNQQAMLFWALQYGLYVEVLKPVALREQIKTAIKDMAARYEMGMLPGE